MSKPTRIVKQGTCAYCSAVGDITDDHVAAWAVRGIMARAVPAKIAIVSAPKIYLRYISV